MVIIVAHRGVHKDVPANTLESFKKARKMKVAAECDVHLSREGIPVVIHDSELPGGGNVRESTLKRLRAVKIDGHFKIPALEEVLELNVPLLFIELKAAHDDRDYPGLTERAIKLIKHLRIGKEKVIFLSFHRGYLRKLNDFPTFRKMLLSQSFPYMENLKSLSLYGLAIEFSALNESNVALAHEQGLKVFAWTPDKEDDIRRMIRVGVDYVCFNSPEVAMRIANE